MEKFYQYESTLDFKSAINANNNELLSLWDCHENTFREIPDNINGSFISLFNANLRDEVFKTGMSGRELIESLNNKYTQRISRFQDVIIEHVVAGPGHAEPTAIPTDDGTRLDLWYTLGYTYSEDGIHFAEPRNLGMRHETQYENFWCNYFFRHDGYVYCVSVCNALKYLLWRSSDNINFDFVQVLFDPGLPNIGNSFLFEDNGVWYFIYEAMKSGYTGYQLWLASSDSLTGEYTNVQDTPIIIESAYDGIGNPELAMVGSRIFKCDGKYNMFYHYHNTSPGHAIYRATSDDLIHWKIEGPILDARIPVFDSRLSNGDQCFCEFKGHTYLFYTNNANQYQLPPEERDVNKTCIDMCIDYRPFSELLRMKL